MACKGQPPENPGNGWLTVFYASWGNPDGSTRTLRLSLNWRELLFYVAVFLLAWAAYEGAGALYGFRLP